MAFPLGAVLVGTGEYKRERGNRKMRTFKELEKIAIKSNAIPDNLELAEIQCVLSLRCLCREYVNKLITKEDASKEKRFIKKVYDDAIFQDKRYCYVFGRYQDNIRNASTLRSDICKSNSLKEIALKACECIGRMCNDDSEYRITKSKIDKGELE